MAKDLGHLTCPLPAEVEVPSFSTLPLYIQWSGFLIAGLLAGDISVYMAPNILLRCSVVSARL